MVLQDLVNLMNNDNVVTLIGYVFGGIVFWIGLRQYEESQKWKRIEFTIGLMDKFESRPLFNTAKSMLEYTDKIIEFPVWIKVPADTLEKNKRNDGLLKKALEKDENLEKYDIYIRDCFDEFFDDLSQLNLFIEKKFIDFEELKVFLPYWIELIANDRDAKKPDDVIQIIWAFMERYHPDVKKLCQRYGYGSPILNAPKIGN
jgi:hypothetical protein